MIEGVPRLLSATVPEDRWIAATRHPFLDAVREGAIPERAFDTWLVQDALFVADLLIFQARLLARAPRAAQAVLAGGCAALVEELDWFAAKARERSLTLDVTPQPATIGYAHLLERLDTAPYGDAITALAVLERVYLEAWRYAAPASRPYREFVEHWTTPGFAEYVAALDGLAQPGGREDLVAEVLDAEITFWDMALDPKEQG